MKSAASLRMAVRRFEPKYDLRQYAPNTNLSLKEIKREYTRMRDAIVKRIKRIEEKNMSNAYIKKHKEVVTKKIRDMTERELRMAFYQARKFVDATSGGLKKMKESEKRRQETLNDRYDLNLRIAGEMDEFYRFMQFFKSSGLSKIYYEHLKMVGGNEIFFDKAGLPTLKDYFEDYKKNNKMK